MRRTGTVSASPVWAMPTQRLHSLKAHDPIARIYRCISINYNVVKKLIFSCNLFQKVKLFFVLILMIRAYSS